MSEEAVVNVSQFKEQNICINFSCSLWWMLPWLGLLTSPQLGPCPWSSSASPPCGLLPSPRWSSACTPRASSSGYRWQRGPVFRLKRQPISNQDEQGQNAWKTINSRTHLSLLKIKADPLHEWSVVPPFHGELFSLKIKAPAAGFTLAIHRAVCLAVECVNTMSCMHLVNVTVTRTDAIWVISFDDWPFFTAEAKRTS